MELSAPIRIGVVAGTIGLGLAISTLQFCGAVSLPAKPPPPADTLAASQEVLRRSTQTESGWVASLDKDALAAGVEAPTPQAMSKKLVMRADEGTRTLAPGEPAIDAAGLRLSAVESGGTLALVIENRATSDLAYRVVTRVRPDGGCGRRDVDAYNANVVARGGREVRSECAYRGGMSLEISRVESIELSPLSAFYVSKVPPRALGADARLAVGHEPDLPGLDELADDELEPELVDLVDDDEEGLVVVDLALVVVEAALQGEELFDADVLPVVHGSLVPRGGPGSWTLGCESTSADEKRDDSAFSSRSVTLTRLTDRRRLRAQSRCPRCPSRP